MPVPHEAIDLRDGPVRDDVRALLERKLVSGELAPGSRLADEDLLAMTGSSRAPLREALNELALVRLVSVQPRQSTIVTPRDASVEAQSLEIECAVMAQVVAEAVPRITDDDKDKLGAWLRHVSEPAAFAHAVRSRAHRDILDLFVRRAGNSEYARALGSVTPVVDRRAALTADRLGVADHERFTDVLEAAIDGDVTAATVAWTAFSDSVRGDAQQTASATAPSLATPATLRDKAAAVIEREIFAGTLVPGEPLREADLMRWLGVSRTPVREALRALAYRGLVDLSHQRTARVALLDQQTNDEVLRTLAVLRSLEVRLALQREPSAVASEVAAAADAWRAAVDVETVIAAAVDLVAPLDAASGNRILVELASALAARISWSVRHDSESVIIASRDALLGLHAALVAGDADVAEQAVWVLYTGDARQR